MCATERRLKVSLQKWEELKKLKASLDVLSNLNLKFCIYTQEYFFNRAANLFENNRKLLKIPLWKGYLNWERGSK